MKPWISIQVKKQHYSLLVTVTLELGQVQCCQNAVYRTDLYGFFFFFHLKKQDLAHLNPSFSKKVSTLTSVRLFDVNSLILLPA